MISLVLVAEGFCCGINYIKCIYLTVTKLLTCPTFSNPIGTSLLAHHHPMENPVRRVFLFSFSFSPHN